VSRSERIKGLTGEREVAAIYEAAGLQVRGLEGTGDHLVVCSPSSGIVIHSETKRQETARPWAWWEQASSEAPPGTMPVVAFRRNRSPWLGIVDLRQYAELLGRLAELEQASEGAGGVY
jgi:hypothetical protein